MKTINTLILTTVLTLISFRNVKAQDFSGTHFRNGDPIPYIESNEEWVKAGENKQPAWCYYDNDPANGAKYGKLYNWYAVNDPRGLCPVGWHVPSDKEWTKLIDYLGGESNGSVKMKSLSGFSGNFGGSRIGGDDARFHWIGEDGCWWSSTEKETATGWSITLPQGPYSIDRGGLNKNLGLSVRCLKN
jgi:uncharacterized protein (TIGR02145 family)